VYIGVDTSHAAQRRASSRSTRRAAACVFTFHTPRSGVTSLPHTPRSGVYLRFLTQRRLSLPLTRRAAASVLTSYTLCSGVFLHFPHAAQRRVPSLRTRAQRRDFTSHTPLRVPSLLIRRCAACVFKSYAARRVPSLTTRPMSSLLTRRYARRVATCRNAGYVFTSHTPLRTREISLSVTSLPYIGALATSSSRIV
jgi:hypothetical protein